MPRVRRLDVFVPDHDAPRYRFAAAMAQLSTAYGQALLDLELTGPCSSIMIVAHPADRGADGVLVLVHCDRPEDSEMIAVRLPDDVAAASTTDVAHLAADVLDGGLTRLAVARGWDGVTGRLAQARAEDLDGTPSHRWAVTTQGRSVTAPEQPHALSVVGGGPTNGVSPDYSHELDRLLDRLGDAAMVDWWRQSPVKLGEVYYWFDAKRPGVRVTVTRRVNAAILRPVETIRLADPVALARADISALLARLATRLDLPTAPLLTEIAAAARD